MFLFQFLFFVSFALFCVSALFLFVAALLTLRAVCLWCAFQASPSTLWQSFCFKIALVVVLLLAVVAFVTVVAASVSVTSL